MHPLSGGQGFGQYRVKHTENGQTQTDNVGVGLDRFYCILVLTIFLLHWLHALTCEIEY